jgi:hypothetical protein
MSEKSRPDVSAEQAAVPAAPPPAAAPTEPTAPPPEPTAESTAAPPSVTPGYVPPEQSGTPAWRTILDGHTAWRELTADLDVEYRPDGVRIAYVPPDTGRKLMNILNGTMPVSPRGGLRANGELSVGLGG